MPVSDELEPKFEPRLWSKVRHLEKPSDWRVSVIIRLSPMQPHEVGALVEVSGGKLTRLSALRTSVYASCQASLESLAEIAKRPEVLYMYEEAGVTAL